MGDLAYANIIERGQIDVSRRQLFDRRLVASYAELMRDFANDWRAAWLLYGHRAEGLRHYRALIDSARKRLHPNRRALTVLSNGIGVNAIFAQRVLNAALAPEACID